jgi:hypothetical protein
MSFLVLPCVEENTQAAMNQSLDNAIIAIGTTAGDKSDCKGFFILPTIALVGERSTH